MKDISEITITMSKEIHKYPEIVPYEKCDIYTSTINSFFTNGKIVNAQWDGSNFRATAVFDSHFIAN